LGIKKKSRQKVERQLKKVKRVVGNKRLDVGKLTRTQTKKGSSNKKKMANCIFEKSNPTKKLGWTVWFGQKEERKSKQKSKVDD